MGHFVLPHTLGMSARGRGAQVWVEIKDVPVPQPQELLVLLRGHLCLTWQPNTLTWGSLTRQRRVPLPNTCTKHMLCKAGEVSVTQLDSLVSIAQYATPHT